MQSGERASVLLAMGLLACSACTMDNGYGSCPEPGPPRLLKDGTFASKAEIPFGYLREPKNATSRHPHAGVSDKSLEHDRSRKRVTVRYVRDGKEIVETWRVVDYR